MYPSAHLSAVAAGVAITELAAEVHVYVAPEAAFATTVHDVHAASLVAVQAVVSLYVPLVAPQVTAVAPQAVHPAAAVAVLLVNVWKPAAQVPAVHPAAFAAVQTVHDASEFASRGVVIPHAVQESSVVASAPVVWKKPAAHFLPELIPLVAATIREFELSVHVNVEPQAAFPTASQAVATPPSR